MSCSLNLKNISYKISDKYILKDINLDLGHKEKIAILGSTAKGKTTLAKIIVGLKQAYEGEIYLFHNKINSENDFEKFMPKIGFLFQNVEDTFIFPTVIEEVAFDLLNQKESKTQAYKKSLEILEFFGIKDLKNKFPLKLSGGEKKLVALCAILIKDPSILILDEPTNDLDIKTEKTLSKFLRSMDKSLIIISHKEEFINNIVNKKYLLDLSLKEVN